MSAIAHWTGSKPTGEELERKNHADNDARLEGVTDAMVRLDDGNMLRVHVRAGERMRIFTRREQGMEGPSVDTAVIEIQVDPEHFVRLYLGTTILLSTEELHA